MPNVIPPNNNTSLYNSDSNTQPINNNISVTGNITAGGYISAGGNVFGANFSTAGNVVAGNIIGNIVANLVVPGGNNQVIFNTNGNANASTAFTFDPASNTVAVTGAVTATGNITGNYILGNGSQLTGLPDTYNNANVANFLANFGSNTISTTGNVTAGYFLGDGSQLTNLPIPSVYGNSNVAAFMAAFGSNTIVTTGNVSTGDILATGTISATGNITGNYFIGNGSQLTGITANYSNANVQAYLPTYTGNIAATNLTAATTTATGNISIGGTTVLTATPEARVVSSQDLRIFAAAAEDLFLSNPSISMANIWLDAGNIRLAQTFGSGNTNVLITGQVSATGNITGDYFIGNGSQLTGIVTNYSNANVSNLMASFGSNVISSTGNITTTANIAGGNILASGLISATGNVTGNYIIGDGSQLTNLPPGNYSNANVSNLMASFGSNVISSTGNITTTANIASGNLLNTGTVYTPQIESATDLDLNTASKVNVNGNMRVGDNNTNTQIATHGAGDLILRTHEGAANQGSIRIYDGADGNIDIDADGTGVINLLAQASATGNISAPYFIGNGSQLTGIVSSYSNANVANYLPIYSGNIGNTTSTVNVPGTMNANVISATGNITGNYFIGDGSQLTGITSSYGNANVSSFLAVYGANVISSTGNITTTANIAGGNLLTTGIVSATGNVIGGNVRSLGFLSVVGNVTLAGSNVFANSTKFDTGPIDAGGAINGTSLNMTGNITATSNTAGLRSNGFVSAAGNITGGNILTAGLISATGNITGNYFIGNGSQLTGIVANSTYNDSNVASFLAAFGSNTISTTGTITSGNITGSNLLTAGVVSATGNIRGANFLTSGAVSATSDITTVANISGNNITSSTNTTAGNFLTAGFVTAAGNVTGGNLITTGNLTVSNINMTGQVFDSSGVLQLNAVGNIVFGPTGVNLFYGNVELANGTVKAGNVTYTNVDGTNGQVLTTYGNGITYFSTVSGGGGGSNIANGTSNVNIATANGNVTFGVAGTANVIVVDSGNVYTGNIRGPSSTTAVQLFNYKDKVYSFGNATGTITPDPANGSIQNLTLTGNITLNAFGGTPQAGQSMTLICKQDATGNRLLTSTMLWAGNTKTLSTAANAVDMIFTFYDGTNYYASLSRGFV